MADDKKSVKTVPESDLIAIKNILRDKEKKWDAEREKLTLKTGQLENELKIAKANGDDSEEVAMVKKGLIDQADRVKADREKLGEDLNSYTKREREFRAREIASGLKVRGLEITPESLLAEDDMDSKAKDLLVEHLAKENETLKQSPGKGSPESVFETGSGGVLKKQVKDMTDDEFKSFERQIKQVALSK